MAYTEPTIQATMTMITIMKRAPQPPATIAATMPFTAATSVFEAEIITFTATLRNLTVAVAAFLIY